MARQVSLGVLISGGGTNLQAIIDAIEAKKLDAKIEIVLSNKADAFGLVRAKKHKLPTAVLDHKAFPSREAYDQAVVDLLRARGVELVALAGFMRLLSPAFVKAYSNRIMNIHPALLPSFAGLNVQKKAIEHGVRFSG
jgi:phosphoribosylglycinamide formyltransferase-1